MNSTTEKAPAAGKPRTTKKAPAKPAPTFADMARGYLDQLDKDGKSESTIFGYRMELRTAASVLGEDTSLAEITPEKVQAYFASAKVTKNNRRDEQHTLPRMPRGPGHTRISQPLTRPPPAEG